MKATVLLSVFVVLYGFTAEALGSYCSTHCNLEACGDDYCVERMTIWGTSVCDQGDDCRGNSQGNGVFQCVELFKRVEREVFDHKVGSVRVAHNVYINATTSDIKLQRFANDSTDVPPPPSYHLVYDHRNGVGHVVTIISLEKVAGEENKWDMTIAEQNWTEDCKYTHKLTRDPVNKTYTVDNRGSYTVLGWVRNPKLEYVGKYEDGFRIHNGYSDAFTDAYANALGKLDLQLGKPFDNGSSKYVHSWPDDSSHPDALFVQDFKTNNGKWSMIVYNEDLEKAFVVNDKILEFWTSHWGYADFGPPVELHKHLFLIVL